MSLPPGPFCEHYAGGGPAPSLYMFIVFDMKRGADIPCETPEEVALGDTLVRNEFIHLCQQFFSDMGMIIDIILKLFTAHPLRIIS